MVTVRDVIEDCHKAAKMYRQEWPRAVSPDSVAMIYERIAGSLERVPAQQTLEPVGYLIPKSGIDNGNYFIEPHQYAHVEERFRHLYTPVYTLTSTERKTNGS